MYHHKIWPEPHDFDMTVNAANIDHLPDHWEFLDSFFRLDPCRDIYARQDKGEKD